MLTRVIYSRSLWRSQPLLGERASRLPKVIGRTDYADAATTVVATRVCVVPFSAPTVCLDEIHLLITLKTILRLTQHMFIFPPFSAVLMAQVMTRMRLTWLGEYSNSRSKKSTCRKVLCVVFTYFTIMVTLTIVEELNLLQYFSGDWKAAVKNTYFPVVKMISFVFFTLWALYSLCMTRESVRVRYSIRQKPYFCGCEDLCCSAFCPCLTAAQLARHTGEYETYSASCFTETGHVRGTPRL